MKALSIQSIEFYAGSSEMQLNSQIVQNNLSYPSIIKLSSSVFNKLFNALQKLNPDLDLYGLLSVENHPEGDTFYKLTTTDIDNIVNFDLIEESAAYKMIRA